MSRRGAPARAGMACCSPRRAHGPRGCPRPRGDGPCDGGGSFRAIAVPPPARGWPRSRAARRDLLGGAPARAGMAPSGGRRAPPQGRCPRPRGDGPRRPAHPRDHRAVPPPARGWPLEHQHRARGQRGAPARAGMARRTSRRAPRASGCPRPRGDGPPMRPGSVVCSRVPPPARGWPPAAAWLGRVQQGAPARAGMAPASARAREPTSRCPRPRGDGPRVLRVC